MVSTYTRLHARGRAPTYADAAQAVILRPSCTSKAMTDAPTDAHAQVNTMSEHKTNKTLNTSHKHEIYNKTINIAKTTYII